MKTIAFCLCTLALPMSLFATEQIEVEAMFIKANASASPLPHDFAKLNQTAGVDLLSLPRFSTHSGQGGTVEITHDFSPASVASKGFAPVPTGIMVDVTPEIKEGHLTYTAHVTARDLMGVKDEGGQKLSETTSHELYLSGTPADGEWVWIEISDAVGGQKRMVCLRLTRQKA